MPRVGAYISQGRGQQAAPNLFAHAFRQQFLPVAAAVKQGRDSAVRVANRTSKAKLKPVTKREAKRPGRDYQSIKDNIEWKHKNTVGVALDVQKLRSHSPHWIIQEIGTGERANMKSGGTPLPKGRPRKDAPTSVSVESQVGRRIWVIHDGTDTTIRFAKNTRKLKRRVGKRKKDQLPGNASIGREIKGQHFIQAGAKEGFRVYRTSILSAARRSFPAR